MKKIIVSVVAFALLASACSVIGESKNSTAITDSVNKTEAVPNESISSNSNNDAKQGTAEKLLPADYTVINPPEPRKVVYVKSELNTVISGKVKLPEGEAAPKGGLKVRIDAGINPNTMSYEVLRGGAPFPINSIDIIISEGKNSAPYEIPVVNYYSIDGTEYKPWYTLSFSFVYINNGKTDGQFGFYKGPIDISLGNQANIDYTFENYDISLFK